MNSTDDTDEALTTAGAAVVPNMSRRMSRIRGDSSGSANY